MAATNFTYALGWDNSTTDNATLWAVTYVYSVSGCYTFFQRIFFYLVMIFVFTFRFFEWFTAAGVTFVIALSSTAGLHGIALSLQHEVGSDLDQIALMITLTPIGLGAVVYALYPPPIFNRNPKPLFVVWTIFLSISMLCLTVNYPRFLDGLNDMATTVLCSETATICNDTCTSLVSNALFRTANDQCVAFYLGPASLFQSLNYTGGFNVEEFKNGSFSSTDIDSGESVDDYINTDFNNTWRYIIIGLISGIILRSTVVNMSCRPRKARDKVFRRLISKRTVSGKKLVAARMLTWTLYVWNAVVFLIWPLYPINFILWFLYYCCFGKKLSWIFNSLADDFVPSRWKLLFAKFMASAWYLWALFAYITWPVLTIYETVRTESIFYGYLPESESLQAVGQWSTWVAVALAFVAALISRMCTSSEDATRDKREAISLNSLETAIAPLTISPLALRRPPKWFGTWHGCWDYLIVASEEWEDFKSWYKDPISASRRTLDLDEVEDKMIESDIDLKSVWSKISLHPASSRRKDKVIYNNVCQRKRWARYVPCTCDSCTQEGNRLLDVSSLYVYDDLLEGDELKEWLQKSKVMDEQELQSLSS